MIILSFGSNLGNREENIRIALHLLAGENKLQIQKISSLYETEPVGFADQNFFLNAVALITTDLSPEELIKHCLAVEVRMGRVRDLRWGPRNIDIDVLCYHDLVIQTELLTLPHPRMRERRFILLPLLEVAGDIALPGNILVSKALADCQDHSAVLQIKPTGWEGQEIYG